MKCWETQVFVASTCQQGAPGGGCVPNDLAWESVLWRDARWARSYSETRPT